MSMSWPAAYRRLVEQKHPLVKGRSISAFKPFTAAKTFSISAAAGGAVSSSSATVDFATGAVILGISAGVTDGIAAAAITQQTRALSAVRLGLEYTSGEGVIITGGPVLASALFGLYGDRQWPVDVIGLERGSVLLATVHNLTTSAILFDLAFDCMIPRRL